MSEHTNVLVIMTDEQQAAALSCAGHPLVKTPNLDRLAERGVRFSNAYTPSPICVPARAAFATGQYVHDIGFWDNALAYDGLPRSWGHSLQSAGVAPVSVGKLHYRNAEDDTGFAAQIAPLHILDGVGQVWGSVRDPLPEEPRSPNMLGGIGPGQSKYNSYDEEVAERCAARISGADPKTPWMMFASFVAPHFPLIVPQRYLDLYPAADMPLPSLRPGESCTLHPWLARMSAYHDPDQVLRDDAERRLAIACYYALCTFVDELIGKLLSALEKSGQTGNTMVIFTSDHGEMLGERGRWGKSTLYGESTRIPMILAGPGVPEGHVSKTPVSLLDAVPTIAQAMGVEPERAWVGTSLLDLIAKGEDPERCVFSEYHAVASPSAGFMLANARWKYHEYVGYPPELFDLDADPGETRNLADDPGHAEVLAQMRRGLRKICDPEETDRAAKADQNALVARFGGVDAALDIGPKGASPVPARESK
ncbi:choline-sulfatase [Alloyangia pacifica]|uniref:Choline-sulfatase n=1 Tax=Alloyangia pacifica TaxID=311180 RepID=A0A1I6VIV2_9RHOB|nr:sulfatase-like hydrolase/transferase [Alloyangia pacifica]SDI00435.1 choline-sulfatase [Alloyangia pacifica]SFT13676.1 choline-sulfatase [Alloyangia pacifica]